VSHRNRNHPAGLVETLQITVETIEAGDGCQHIVFIAGHGGKQRQVVPDRAGVLQAITDGLEDWQTYCDERLNAERLERTEVAGAVDLPA